MSQTTYFEQSHNDNDQNCKDANLLQVGIVIGCVNCAYTIYSWNNLDGSRNELFTDEQFNDSNKRSERLNEIMSDLSKYEKDFAERPSVKAYREKIEKAEFRRKIKLARIIKKEAIKVYPCRVRRSWNDCDHEALSKSGLEQHMILDHTESELDIAAGRYN